MAGVGNLIIYDESQIKLAMEELFGSEIDVSFMTVSNMSHCYEFYNGNYYSYDFAGGGEMVTPHGYSQIQTAEQNGDYIYIYDKFIYGRLDVVTAEFYTDSTMKNLIDTSDLDWADMSEKEIASDLISKYESQLNTYKHTFKKGENGNYYWVSTEIDK